MQRYSSCYTAAYFDKIVSKFHTENAKTVKTPFAQHFRLSSAQSPIDKHELDDMKSVPYASLVGSLMYGMVCSRPDVAHSMSIVGRYMENPGRSHWEACKWIVRYLKGTTKKGLLYTKSKIHNETIVGFADFDYTGDLDKRLSLTGYVFTLFGNVISWRSTLQSVVALSSTEAEYIAFSKSVKEAMWLKGNVSEMYNGKCEVEIHYDGQSTLSLMKNPTYHNRTKHIDIKFHYVR